MLNTIYYEGYSQDYSGNDENMLLAAAIKVFAKSCNYRLSVDQIYSFFCDAIDGLVTSDAFMERVDSFNNIDMNFAVKLIDDYGNEQLYRINNHVFHGFFREGLVTRFKQFLIFGFEFSWVDRSQTYPVLHSTFETYDFNRYPLLWGLKEKLIKNHFNGIKELIYTTGEDNINDLYDKKRFDSDDFNLFFAKKKYYRRVIYNRQTLHDYYSEIKDFFDSVLNEENEIYKRISNILDNLFRVAEEYEDFDQEHNRYRIISHTRIDKNLLESLNHIAKDIESVLKEDCFVSDPLNRKNALQYCWELKTYINWDDCSGIYVENSHSIIIELDEMNDDGEVKVTENELRYDEVDVVGQFMRQYLTYVRFPYNFSEDRDYFDTLVTTGVREYYTFIYLEHFLFYSKKDWEKSLANFSVIHNPRSIAPRFCSLSEEELMGAILVTRFDEIHYLIHRLLAGTEDLEELILFN